MGIFPLLKGYFPEGSLVWLLRLVSLHAGASLLHCKACLGEIEQFNYNVSLLALLWSFRNLCVKM
jgi:hypothetical protein